MSGRPSDFSQELADLICERISDGESLRSICEDDDLPSRTTVFRWLAKNLDFRDQYARAREEQADVLVEEMLEIADDSSGDEQTDEHGNVRLNSEFAQRSKLRVDTRKWIASKLKPKKYGEKVTQEITGPEGGPVQIQRIELVPVVPDLNDDGTS